MKRLIAVQQQLKAIKDKKGDGGRFQYRSAEDILEKVKPLLEKQHLAVTLSDTIVLVGDRIFLKATATLWGEDGTCNETFGWAELDKHLSKSGYQSMSNEQCTGSASSYARKYALCGLFAIDDSDQDPDGMSQSEEPKAPTKAQPAKKTLTTRIAEAKNENDINELIPEMKGVSEEEKKVFNAQVANLLLVYDKSEKKYIKAIKDL